MHDLSGLHLFVRRHAIHGSNDLGVAQVELRSLHLGTLLLHLGCLALRIGSSHADLPHIGMRRGHSGLRL